MTCGRVADSFECLGVGKYLGPGCFKGTIATRESMSIGDMAFKRGQSNTIQDSTYSDVQKIKSNFPEIIFFVLFSVSRLYLVFNDAVISSEATHHGRSGESKRQIVK